jgi:hypothetical protein
MSIRALGRQFITSLKNPPFSNWEHPRAAGKLFDPGATPKYRPDADVKESGRRRNAGEANPDAPWDKGRILQHHFPGYDPRTRHPRTVPVQGSLDL